MILKFKKYFNEVAKVIKTDQGIKRLGLAPDFKTIIADHDPETTYAVIVHERALSSKGNKVWFKKQFSVLKKQMGKTQLGEVNLKDQPLFVIKLKDISNNFKNIPMYPEAATTGKGTLLILKIFDTVHCPIFNAFAKSEEVPLLDYKSLIVDLEKSLPTIIDRSKSQIQCDIPNLDVNRINNQILNLFNRYDPCPLPLESVLEYNIKELYELIFNSINLVTNRFINNYPRCNFDKFKNSIMQGIKSTLQTFKAYNSRVCNNFFPDEFKINVNSEDKAKKWIRLYNENKVIEYRHLDTKNKIIEAAAKMISKDLATGLMELGYKGAFIDYNQRLQIFSPGCIEVLDSLNIEGGDIGYDPPYKLDAIYPENRQSYAMSQLIISDIGDISKILDTLEHEIEDAHDKAREDAYYSWSQNQEQEQPDDADDDWEPDEDWEPDMEDFDNQYQRSDDIGLDHDVHQLKKDASKEVEEELVKYLLPTLVSFVAKFNILPWEVNEKTDELIKRITDISLDDLDEYLTFIEDLEKLDLTKESKTQKRVILAPYLEKLAPYLEKVKEYQS